MHRTRQDNSIKGYLRIRSCNYSFFPKKQGGKSPMLKNSMRRWSMSVLKRMLQP